MRSLAALCLLAQPALAAAQTAETGTAADIAALLRAEGYVATVGSDPAGDPMIQSAAQGVDWTLFFYDCGADGTCGSVQFTAGFVAQDEIPLERMNAWNKGARFTRAYLDDDGDPILEMDVNLGSGIPEDTMRDNIGLWSAGLGQFLRHIGW